MLGLLVYCRWCGSVKGDEVPSFEVVDDGVEEGVCRELLGIILRDSGCAIHTMLL